MLSTKLSPLFNLSSTITLDYTIAKKMILHVTLFAWKFKKPNLSPQFFLQVNAIKTPAKNANDVVDMISAKAVITWSPYLVDDWNFN